MKNFFTLALLLLCISCGVPTTNSVDAQANQNEPVYIKEKHKPATQNEWEVISNSIMYINLENEGEMLLAPAKRNIKYRASHILAGIHSWFKEAGAFVKMKRSGFELLVLKKIPKPVLDDILGLAFTTQTGFGILDKKHWATVGRLQDQGYNIALIEDSSEPIAGLYIESLKLIAFDVFSNSGTLTHELRHEQQHQKLINSSGLKPDLLPDSCIQELSLFFGELDATTEQLPEWRLIVETANYAPTAQEFESSGGKNSFLAFFKALSANLYYPVSNSTYAVYSKSCPNEVKEAVLKLSQLVEGQKEKFFALDINFLRYQSRNQVFASLNKMNNLCSDSSLINECNEQVKLHEILLNKIKISSIERSKLLELFYSERKNVFPLILSSLDSEIRNEMCRRVSGYYFVDSCVNQ